MREKSKFDDLKGKLKTAFKTASLIGLALAGNGLYNKIFPDFDADNIQVGQGVEFILDNKVVSLTDNNGTDINAWVGKDGAPLQVEQNEDFFNALEDMSPSQQNTVLSKMKQTADTKCEIISGGGQSLMNELAAGKGDNCYREQATLPTSAPTQFPTRSAPIG